MAVTKDGATILCLDFGTSSIKAGIINQKGDLLSLNNEPLLQSHSEDFANWDPRRWLRGLRRVLGQLKALDGIDAVTVSGNGPTLVPVDSSGEPLHPALFWLEGREEKSIADDPSFFLPKAAWFFTHRGELYDKTEWFLSCPEYISFILTGEARTFIPSREFAKHIWTPGQIIRYGLDENKFPPPVPTGEIIGKVIRSAAEKFGLPPDIPVCAGGPDFLMALAGTGTVETGRVCDRAGTSEGINYCSDTPVNDPRLRTLPHLIEGKYNVAGILASSGRVFEWLRSISGLDRYSYEEMLRKIIGLPHEENTPSFFPSLHSGATWEFAGGAFFNLQPYHSPEHLGRAVVEAIGFGVRDHLETLEERGCTFRRMVTSGGQARNSLWLQMKADITGKEIAVPGIVDAELLGNCCAGMTGLGIFDSITLASRKLLKIEEVFSPRKDEYEAFSSTYSRYNRICSEAMDVVFHERKNAIRKE